MPTHDNSSYLSSYLWYTFESGHLTLVSGAGEGEVVSVIHARHAKDQMRGRPRAVSCQRASASTLEPTKRMTTMRTRMKWQGQMHKWHYMCMFALARVRACVCDPVIFTFLFHQGVIIK